MKQQVRPHPLALLRQQAMDAHKAGKSDEAREFYERYLLGNPADAGMWSNLGALHRSEGRHVLARAAQLKAYALDPTSNVIRGNLANISTDLGDYELAVELRKAVLKEVPDDENMKAMMGKALRGMGRHDEGIAFLEQAVREHPDYAEMRIQLALTQLASARYAEGFRNYEARWETGELTRREIEVPEWDCTSSLEGKRILVVPEQGFGDTMTFARFIPELRRFNPDRVLLFTEKPVQRILSKVKGVDWAGIALPEGEYFDIHVNMMDLPRLAFERSDEVPEPTRIAVPQDSRDRAREIIRPYRDTFNVGLVWCGSLTYRGNAFRSFSHRDYHPLLTLPETQFFSLYKGPKAEALHQDGTSSLIFDVAQSERDFADNAAMMKELDLVITSCTATAHLAGSLGVPTWVLLHWDSFWLWRRGTDTTPWYPSVRLFRQDTPMDWPGVMARVRSALTDEIAAHRKEKADG